MGIDQNRLIDQFIFIEGNMPGNKSLDLLTNHIIPAFQPSFWQIFGFNKMERIPTMIDGLKLDNLMSGMLLPWTSACSLGLSKITCLR